MVQYQCDVDFAAFAGHNARFQRVNRCLFFLAGQLGRKTGVGQGWNCKCAKCCEYGCASNILALQDLRDMSCCVPVVG